MTTTTDTNQQLYDSLARELRDALVRSRPFSKHLDVPKGVEITRFKRMVYHGLGARGLRAMIHLRPGRQIEVTEPREVEPRFEKILQALREELKNRAIEVDDVAEWKNSEIDAMEGEVVVHLPALGVWVAVPEGLDRREPW